MVDEKVFDATEKFNDPKKEGEKAEPGEGQAVPGAYPGGVPDQAPSPGLNPNPPPQGSPVFPVDPNQPDREHPVTPAPPLP